MRWSRFSGVGPVGELVRQAVLLLRPTARTTSWLPILAGGAVGLLPVYFARENPVADPSQLIQAIRMSAVVLAVSASSVLDDPTEDSTAHLPAPRLLRRTLRVAVIIPLVAALWLLALLYANGAPSLTRSLPYGALALELAAFLSVVLASAGVAVRWLPERLGGVAAGPALLGLVGASMFLPPGLAVFVGSPVDPRWTVSHVRWWLVLSFALAMFAYVSGDPGRRTGGPTKAWERHRR